MFFTTELYSKASQKALPQAGELSSPGLAGPVGKDRLHEV